MLSAVVDLASARRHVGRLTIPVALSLLSLAVAASAPASADAAPPPNVVLIYADDLGYGDVGAYGATRIATPRIDRLAAEGLRFTDAHSPAATCTPSRYALLTGEYAWRRPGTKVLPGDARLIIEPGRTTLASLLTRAGYATGVVGKWHLGLGDGRIDWNGAIRPGPREIGFGYSFLIPATGDRVPCVYVEDGRVVGLDPHDPIAVSYGEPVGDEPTGKAHPELLKLHPSHGHDQTIVNGISRIGYMTGGRAARWVDEDMADVITARARAFLERHRDEPFFLYYATHDIHVPRVPHARFAGRSGLGPRGDVILQLDWAVGEILDTLERLALEERTLVIFTSDNGPVVDDGYQDDAVRKLDGHRPAGPLRGGKYSAFEGGTRVPLVVRWPGRVKPGVSEALVGQVDLLASLASLTGQKLEPADAPDSLDVLDALLGSSTSGREQLVEQAQSLSLICGKWKLIEASEHPAFASYTSTELGNAPRPQLYDLAADLGERKDVAAEHPGLVRELGERLARIRSEGRSEAYPPPRFADPDRVTKLESALPEIDRLFRAFATDKKIPGMVWGVVIDDRLAHLGSFGVRERASQAAPTSETAFRIASMTKSFTALAVLKLRDEGRLSLEDPVSRWIPELARMELPTRDTPPLRIRQLLSHSAGFPEDNPWGDQQLSASDATLDEWLRKGIPFSTPPGTRYEYSNYAFALLGRVVAQASGVPYETYLRQEILAKLQMDGTTFEFSTIPAARRAIGYRLKPDGSYAEEPPLPHGVFGAMGGLLTTASDLGRYVAFHLSAWPPRDDPEAGPVRRASVREMARLWTPSYLKARQEDGAVQASEAGYGFGLRVSADCRFEHIVAHGGGLPGFGSYMEWLPDYGVGMFAMATLTYSGPATPISRAWDAMLRTGGLRRRELPPTLLQARMRDQLWSLWQRWDDAELKQIAAVNLLLDAPSDERQAGIRRLKQEVGECTAAGPVMPENWLRGQFNISCANGTVGVFFTLSPTEPPAVQHLAFQKLAAEGQRMGAPTGAPAGVTCSPAP